MAVHWLRGFSVCRLVDSMLQRKQGVIERLVEGEAEDEEGPLSPTEILKLLLTESPPAGTPVAQSHEHVVDAMEVAALGGVPSLFERCAARLAAKQAGKSEPETDSAIDSLFADVPSSDSDSDSEEDSLARGLSRVSMSPCTHLLCEMQPGPTVACAEQTEEELSHCMMRKLGPGLAQEVFYTQLGAGEYWTVYGSTGSCMARL